MIFKQIRSTDGSGTLSYILADAHTGNGLIIDPNIEDVQTIKEFISANRIKLKYIIDTHTHVDHISGAGKLKELYNSLYVMHENTRNKWEAVEEGDKLGVGDILRANAVIEVDEYVKGGEDLILDSLKFKLLFTPGHTDNHLALLIEDKLFTGDLLLIGQAGRSDLPGGNIEDQYKSLFDIILKLPDSTRIYPGHDYEDNEFSYLRDEIKNNPFLQVQSLKEYKDFVRDFFPPITEMTEGGKATMQCGVQRVIREDKYTFKNIDAGQLYELLSKENNVYLLDVRESFELIAFGQIPGVVNIPMGSVISRIGEIPKDGKIVVVCQSGNRSLEVAHYLSVNGFADVYNLRGGTTGWLHSEYSRKAML